MNERKRAVSSTPAMPITRFLSKPVVLKVTYDMTSRGFETTRTIASGQRAPISLATPCTISAFFLSRSSRLMPGFRARPAVTMTISDPSIRP